MTVAEVAASIVLTMMNAALLVLAVNLIQRKRVDSLRERLFRLRAELFDMAQSGRINFRDDAYLLIRQDINRLLRYAHRVNNTGFLIVACAMRFKGLGGNEDRAVTDALSNVSDAEVRKRLESIREKYALALCWHVPVFFVLLLVVAAFRRLAEGTPGTALVDRARIRTYTIGSFAATTSDAAPHAPR